MKFFMTSISTLLLISLFSVANFAAQLEPNKAQIADLNAVLYIVKASNTASSSDKLPSEIKEIGNDILSISGRKNLMLEDSFVARINPTGRLSVKGFTSSIKSADIESTAEFNWIMTGVPEVSGNTNDRVQFAQFHFGITVPYKTTYTNNNNEVRTAIQHAKVEITTNSITPELSKPLLMGKITNGPGNNDPYYIVLLIQKVR